MSSYTLNLMSNISSIDKDLKDLFNRYSTMNVGFNSNSIKQMNSMVQNMNQGFSSAGKDFIGSMKEVNKQGNMFIRGLKKGPETLAKGMEKTVKGLSNIQGILDARNLVSGFESASASLKGMGKGAKQFSNTLRASASQSTGLKKGLLNISSKAAAGFGTLVTVLGSVAGMFSSVISMMIDAEAQAKNMNKSLLSGGVSVADMAKGMGDVKGALQTVRKAAVDFNNNMQFGTVAEEQMSILKAFNETGFTLKKMTKGTKTNEEAMKAYQDVTKTALIYAKTMGVEVETIAQAQGEYMRDQGMSLKSVEKSFAAVFQASQAAGFGTSRFYSIVQQATSGMAMYNVRIEQTAGLMVTLSKVMSPEKAGEFLQSLTKGYGDMDYQSRVKEVLLVGDAETKKVIEYEAKNMAKTFADNVKGMTTDEGGPSISSRVENELGLKLDDPGGMVDKLSKMSLGEKADLVAKARQIDPTGNLSQQISKLGELARGTSGEMPDMTMAMDQLGPGGVLAMQMGKAVDILGPIHERSMVELMATESMAGISGEQLLMMRKVSEAMYGNWDQAQIMATQLRGMDANSEEAKKLNEKMLDSYGVVVNGQGDIVQAAKDTNGKIVEGSVVKDIQGYMMTQGDAMTEMATATAVDEQTALAMQVAQNTTDLNTIMEMGVQYFLEMIYGTLGGIGDIFIKLYNWIIGRWGKPDAQIATGAQKEQLQTQLKTDTEKLNAGMTSRATEMGALEKDMLTSSGEEKIKKKQQLAALQLQQDTDKETAKSLKDKQAKLSKGMTVGELEALTAETQSATTENLRKKSVLGDLGEAYVPAGTDLAGITEKASGSGAAFNVVKDTLTKIGASDALAKAGNIYGDMGMAVSSPNALEYTDKEKSRMLDTEVLDKRMAPGAYLDVLSTQENTMRGLSESQLKNTSYAGGAIEFGPSEMDKEISSQFASSADEIKSKRVSYGAELKGIKNAFGPAGKTDWSDEEKSTLGLTDGMIGFENSWDSKNQASYKVAKAVGDNFSGLKGSGGKLSQMGITSADGTVDYQGETLNEADFVDRLKAEAFKRLDTAAAFDQDPAAAAAKIEEALPVLIDSMLNEVQANRAAGMILSGESGFSLPTASGEALNVGAGDSGKLAVSGLMAQADAGTDLGLAMAAPEGIKAFEDILTMTQEESDAKILAAEATYFDKLIAADEVSQKKAFADKRLSDKDLAKETGKATAKELGEQEITNFINALEAAGVQDTDKLLKKALNAGSLGAIRGDLSTIGSGMSPEMIAKVAGTSSTGATFLQMPVKSAEDFIVTDTGNIIMPSSQDTIIGFKPGGPIDGAMKSMQSGGGGGGAVVNINISGGNVQEVYNTVMKVMTTLKLV